jgi:hypothetical protein
LLRAVSVSNGFKDSRVCFLSFRVILNCRMLNRECPPAKVGDRGGNSNNCVNIKVMMLHPVCLNVRRTGPILKSFSPLRNSLFLVHYSISSFEALPLDPFTPGTLES